MKNKQHISIIGAGESGVGAAKLAQRLGYDVFVSDKSPIKEGFKTELDTLGIPYEAGSHTESRILASGLIIKSPGIPPSIPLLQKARDQQIEIIGEIEFGYRHAGKCRIVGITGTNGKTTTTYLTHHLLQYAGLPAQLGGNIGLSFAEMVAHDLDQGRTNDENRLFVLEISSYQLDDCVHFRPNIGMILNITPDHLDRYGNMSNYTASKFRMAANQRRGDLLILNGDDRQIQDYLTSHQSAVHGKLEQVHADDLTHGYVRVGQLSFDLGSTHLKGPHNFFNAACAIRAALRLGVEPSVIEEALFYFKPPAHRLELIAEHNGLVWINDSKATNVDAVLYALQAMDRPTVWILGGVDKGNDYSILYPHALKKVSAIVCLGKDNQKILEAFAGLNVPMAEAGSAEEAVTLAAAVAEPGNTILLSPACASFDLFQNFEHRGEAFREAVLRHINLNPQNI